jgi:hypothetical protein
MSEAEAKKACSERGWVLQKSGKSYRITGADGTLIAADWTDPDGYGLSLADVAAVLEP